VETDQTSGGIRLPGFHFVLALSNLRVRAPLLISQY